MASGHMPYSPYRLLYPAGGSVEESADQAVDEIMLGDTLIRQRSLPDVVRNLSGSDVCAFLLAEFISPPPPTKKKKNVYTFSSIGDYRIPKSV